MYNFEHGAKFVFQSTSLQTSKLDISSSYPKSHYLTQILKTNFRKLSMNVMSVGEGPMHHLHIPGGVKPTRDKVEIMLVVLHVYKIYGREALAAYELWYK